MIRQRRRPLLSVLWLLALPLPGCSPEPIIARSKRGAVTLVQETVGPRGARLQGGDVEVEIPPGALPVDTQVTVQKVPRGGGSKSQSLQLTGLAVSGDCAQLRPQGDFLYVLEPTSLVFAKDVRVAIATPGGADGITALTLEGASTGSNGYAASGQKASVLLRDFSAAIDVQTLNVGRGAVYAVSCDDTSCSVSNTAGQTATCTPYETGSYRCQGPKGGSVLVTASSLAELRSLMAAVAAGQGNSCEPAPTCTNGKLDGQETDVDCGGSSCPRCANGKSCTGGDDCTGGACISGVCGTVASCVDGVLNGNETDVDCGGSCERCTEGQACAKDADCESSSCKDQKCSPLPTCTDDATNGNETDTNCGGSTCPACAPGKNCNKATDCDSGLCSNNLCQPATCTDGLKNGDESDKDCGSLCETRCAPGQTCQKAADCLSVVCSAEGKCLQATCDDLVTNGDETDQDCGGSCSKKCTADQTCKTAADCESAVCSAEGKCLAATCSDGVKNGVETDQDCGGSCSTKCGNTKGCEGPDDCDSAVCSSGVCQAPTCLDKVQNSGESGIDCGGLDCAKCGTGGGCKGPDDCESAVCSVEGKCLAATCDDKVKNPGETDEDCGGLCTTKCADLKKCLAPTDCDSGVCSSNVCAPPSCTDGVKNGSETDKDCGGTCLTKCGSTKGCTVGGDCVSGVCGGGECEPPSCTDGVKNGSETDQDCGSSCPTKCGEGKACGNKADCDGFCLEGFCTTGFRVFVTSETHKAGFGGTAGADAICNNLANAAALGGKWLSWTSDQASSPSSRFFHSSVAYKLLDGTVVAGDWADLTDGHLLHTINRNESNKPQAASEVWTGTNTNALLAYQTPGDYGVSCEEWTNSAPNTDTLIAGVIGTNNNTDGGWTKLSYFQQCDRSLPIYCFEQPSP